MRKIIAAAALALFGLAGTAQAALVPITFEYRLDFIDPAVSAQVGLSNGNLFAGTAVYDDTLFQPDGLVPVSSLNLSFGNFSFDNSNDLAGGALLGVGPTNNLTSLYYEVGLTLGGSAAGDYLLSFFGTQMVLTPSGDTVDFKATASAVPLPAALPLLLAGLAMFGWIGRRRSAP